MSTREEYGIVYVREIDGVNYVKWEDYVELYAAYEKLLNKSEEKQRAKEEKKKYFIVYEWNEKPKYGTGTYFYETDKDIFTESEILKVREKIEKFGCRRQVLILNIIPLND